MPVISAMPGTGRAAAAAPEYGPESSAGCMCPPRPPFPGVSVAELLYRILHESVTAAALAEPAGPQPPALG
jgi:hypothetical protein